MEIISENSNRLTSDFDDDLSNRPTDWLHVKKLYTGTNLRTIGRNCFNGCTQLDGIDMDRVTFYC